MNRLKAFFTNNWPALLALALLLLVLFLIYRAGKKQGYGTTIVDDTGTVTGPTQSELDKANSLAIRLKADIEGLNWSGHDDSIYLELAQSSNVVFALVFEKYKALTGNGLASDISGEVYGGWDVITVIINRANALNLV